MRYINCTFNKTLFDTKHIQIILIINCKYHTISHHFCIRHYDVFNVIFRIELNILPQIQTSIKHYTLNIHSHIHTLYYSI